MRRGFPNQCGEGLHEVVVFEQCWWSLASAFAES